MRGISWLAEGPLASQKNLCFMAYIKYTVIPNTRLQVFFILDRNYALFMPFVNFNEEFYWRLFTLNAKHKKIVNILANK
jgi:hypothetical protein